MDPLLQGYVQASDEGDALRELDQIIANHVEPLIKVIVTSKLRVSPKHGSAAGNDAQDLCNEALAQLILRLRDAKLNPGEKQIHSLKDFTAKIAFGVCSEYFRWKFPERSRLSNRLRYLLTHHRDFKLARGANRKMVASLAAWQNRQAAAQLIEFDDKIGPEEMPPPKSGRLSQAARSVLQRINAPVDFQDFVTMMMDVLGIKESADIPEPGGTRQPVVDQMAQREELAQIWLEICALPLRQRCALLFHLRDEKGNGVVTLLPITKTASIRRIAEVLDIPVEKLAAMWNDFPLDDHAIAEYLNITRQQVINLRKSARERLARKLNLFKRKTI